jgi:lactate permease
MLDFILSILPIIWLIIALCVIKMAGWKACGLTVVVSAVVALIHFHMNAAEMGTAILEGVLNALWPICMVIVAALFVYNLVLKTKAMDSIKAMLSSVSSDPMIILLIIGWGFGNFLEGMAGFGTAVAIPAGILVAMGYDPLTCVVACLVVNSTPTAFGSVGVPTSTVAGVTGLNALTISGNIAILQLITTVLSPFLMILIAGGAKALKKSWKFAVLAALAFVIPEFAAAYFIGPELPDIIGSVICMIVLVLAGVAVEKKNPEKKEQHELMKDMTIQKALVAWSPFLLIFVILLLTSSLVPPVHNVIASVTTKTSVYIGENPGTLSFAWLDCPGVKILIAGFIGGLIQRAGIGTIFRTLFETVKGNVKTIFTICSVLSVAKIMGYSGMITALATALVAATGSFYPLISPLVGMIGGFVTGSGTSTGILFGSLQAKAGAAIHVNPEWIVGANMAGGGVGKMISPQNIAIGSAASGMSGKESKILSKTVLFAILYIAIDGVLCMLLA